MIIGTSAEHHQQTSIEFVFTRNQSIAKSIGSGVLSFVLQYYFFVPGRRASRWRARGARRRVAAAARARCPRSWRGATGNDSPRRTPPARPRRSLLRRETQVFVRKYCTGELQVDWTVKWLMYSYSLLNRSQTNDWLSVHVHVVS